MPPLPAAGSVLRCQLRWNDASDVDVTSTMFFAYTGTSPNAAACNDLANELVNLVGGHNGLWTPTTALIGCQVTDLSSDTGGQGQATVSYVGNRTGEDLAGGTCICASYQIGRRYRGGKPRNYFPWGSATALVSRQTWDPTFVAACVAGIASFVSGFIGYSSGGTTVSSHSNVSYYSGFTVEGGTGGKRARNVSTPRAVPMVNAITGIVVNPSPSSQRRRNKG